MRATWRNWYDAHLARWIPSYAFFPLIGCFLWNCLIYWGTQQIILGMELPVHDVTTALDRMVPFQPAWAFVYVLSYPFWVVSYALTARESSREGWFRFVFADMLAKAICGVIFMAYPTTNIRPDIPGSGIWDWLMGLIYRLDSPLNLFPSLHCMASTMSWLGVRKCTSIPAWYRYFTLCFAVLIFASTLFTRQHCFADVIGGIGVALGCYLLSRRWNPKGCILHKNHDNSDI